MIFGKYGKMILANMERNYPYRKQELELTGELKITDIDLTHNIIKVEHTISIDAEEKTIIKDTKP